MSPLSVVFMIAAAVAALGVVGSFLWGVVVMTRGRKTDTKTSNRMMQLRVICQGLALLFLFLAYAAR